MPKLKNFSASIIVDRRPLEEYAIEYLLMERRQLVGSPQKPERSSELIISYHASLTFLLCLRAIEIYGEMGRFCPCSWGVTSGKITLDGFSAGGQAIHPVQ